MKGLLLTIFLVCICLFDSSSQTKLHMFSINSGISRHLERDDAISPFIYRGTTIPIEFNYKYETTTNSHTCILYYDKLSLASSLPDFETQGLKHRTKNTNLQLEYYYSRKVFSLPNHGYDFFVGGGLDFLLNYRRHSFSNFQDDNNEYTMLDQFNSFAFRVQMTKKFTNTKQLFSFDLCVPFLSYVLLGDTYNAYVGEKIDKWIDSDKNILAEAFKNGDFVSFNKLIDVKINASFIKFLNNHIGFELTYKFQFYRFTQYSHLNYSRNLQNCLLIGFVLK